MKTVYEKVVDEKSLKFDDVHTWDYPEFCDAYISEAEFVDGTPLTDDELELLNADGDFVYTKLMDYLY